MPTSWLRSISFPLVLLFVSCGFWGCGDRSTGSDAAVESDAAVGNAGPGAGVLRGPAVTLLTGAGNDIDQALLLTELLQRAGYRTRFVRGTLELDNQLVLLRGMTAPAIPELRLSADYLPWDSASDDALLALSRDHVWAEVFQGDDWLPLDPSFPRAESGEA